MFKGSYDLIKAIIEKVQLPADLKMLLIRVANHWSKDNPNPFPEYTTLVVEAGIPKRTLPRKLKALKEAGWLEWEHGRGRSNIYTLAVEKIAALSATMALPEMARPDLALPSGEVAPKLGTQVAPKLGTLTNKEQTIYNKQRVEPNKQAAAIIQSLPAEEVSPEDDLIHFMEDEKGNPCMVFDPFNLMPATRSSFPSNKPTGVVKEIEDSVVSTPMRAKDVEPVPQEAPIPHPLLPAFSPPPPQAPPGWDIRGSSGGWSAHGPLYIHFGPFPTRDEAVASAYKVTEMPRRAVEPSMPASVEVQAPSPPPHPVARPPQQASRIPRFMVKPSYNHPGNWVIADTVLEGLVVETDGRRPKTFTDEAAAQTEAQELEMAAA